MITIEEWLEEQGKLTEYASQIVKDLTEEAQFALYCQRGAGSCMGEFGNKVARYAHIFGVDPSEFFNKLLAQAAEVLRENQMDI